MSDAGNSNFSEGAKVEVSTDVVSADGRPNFIADEYVRVVIAKNTADDPPGKLEAFSICKADETGLVTADRKLPEFIQGEAFLTKI